MEALRRSSTVQRCSDWSKRFVRDSGGERERGSRVERAAAWGREKSSGGAAPGGDWRQSARR